MDRVLDTIVELQEARTELERNLALLDGVPESMQELHEQYEEQRGEIERLEAECQQGELDRRAAEIESAAGKEGIERYQEQISRVTTQREYGALLSEIDTLRASMREADEQALLAFERQEAATAQLEEIRDAFRGLEAQYQKELAEWDKQKPDMQKRVETLQGQIEVYRERLPKPAAHQYERLFDRHDREPLAAIRVTEGPGSPIRHCSSCNYRIRPQVVVQIQARGALVQCDSCQRILYIEPT